MNADSVTPDNYTPPPWLAQPGYSKLQVQWLADKLMDRLQRLQAENRQLRGLPPSTDEQDPQMTLPIEFQVTNPIHRERFLHVGGTLRAVPARLQNPAGADVEGIALIDASGQPRALCTRESAWRLADEILAATGAVLPEPAEDQEDA